MGANATPALASDGLDPAPLAEAVAAEAIPALPELEVDEAVPAPEPPIVIDTNIEDGDLDVSVRVLSPGDNGVEAPVETALDAISEALEPDITVDPVMPDAPPAPADPIEQDIVNTNIGVRMLSPGNNGAMGNESGLAAKEPDDPRPDSAPAGELELDLSRENLGGAFEDAPQYHKDNTRYQSDVIPDADPWVWEWYLALDCSGIVTSTSSEIGSPDSGDWDWNWTWDWTCGLDGASEKSGDALQEGFESVASVNSGTGASPAARTSTATGGQPEASGDEPWLWTWTFNFCGRETTFSIQAGAQTSLQWTWDWTWAWACTSAEVVAPATEGEGPSGPAADTGAPSGTLELPPPLAIVIAPFLFEPLLAAPSPEAPWVVETPIPISAAIPLGRSPSTASGPERAPASGPGQAPAQAPALVPIAAATDLATVSPGSSRDERARPAKSRDRDVSPRPARRLPQLPLGPTRRVAGSATSSGGAAPGGGAATGVAALTGFYLLAAPGLGRRLRDARELSPRALAEAPLDRPG